MVVRRLIYISTINLKLKKAQSLQVIRFVKSLYKNSIKEKIIFKSFSLSGVPSNYRKYFKVFNRRLSNRRLNNNLMMLQNLLKFGLVKREDIVYSRDLLILFIFAIFGIKTIYEYHHPSPFINSIFFKIYNLLPNTRLITISNSLKNHFLHNNSWYKKEILVLASSVEIAKYRSIPDKKFCREELGMKNEKYYILHTGSLYYGRGVEKFIELCNFSNDIFFIHLGGSDQDLEKFRNIAIKAGINNCLFLPNVNEEKIIKFQKAADLLFYIITKEWPTYWCCSPLKLPEYMASGTPILASGIGSITEMIDENDAFLFDDNNQSLLDSLQIAKTNPNLAINIANSAKKKVEKFYTLDIRSKLLIKYFREID